MATFADSTGREWAFGFTIGHIGRLKALGIDLNQAFKKGADLADVVYGEPEAVGRLVWELCGKDMEAAGLTPDTFVDRFDGPTLERFGEAFVEALADFFPRSAVGRAIRGRMKTILGQMDAAMSEAVAGVSIPSTSTSADSPARPAAAPPSTT